MTSLATAFVTIRPDTTTFGRSLTSSVDRSAKTASTRMSGHFSSAFKGMAAGLAGVFAVSKGVDFFKGAIDEAREAQKVGAQTSAVLKSTGGAAGVTAKQIGDLATRISKKTAIDDEAIQSGENLLLTFTNIRNEAGKGNKIFDQTSSVMADLSAATGQSMKSSAIQLGKALNDPIKGVTALQRVGVSFSEGQKEQIKRMVESGHSMKAQKLILGELNREFKGSAEAQATPAEKAAVAWGNFKEEIGTAVMPILDKLLTWFTDKGLPAIERFGGWVKDQLAPIVKDLGARFRDDVLPVVKDFADYFAKVLLPKLQDFGGWLKDNKAVVATFVGVLGGFMIISSITKAVMAFNAVLAANPIGIVVVALAALAAGLIYAYKHSETFRKIVDKAWSVIKDAVGSAWKNVIQPALKAMWKFINDDLIPVIKTLWDKVVKPYFKFVGGAIKFAWNNVIQPAFKALWWYLSKVLFPTIKFLWNNVVKPVFKGVGETIKFAWDNVIKPVFTALKDFIGDKLVPAFKWGLDKIGDIWNGLKSAASKPVEFIVNTVYNDGIRVALNKIPGVHLGEAHFDGFAKGGWTGPGGKYDPAGIVHADEYVINKKSRRAVEGDFPGLLDTLNGYANGGRVAHPSQPVTMDGKHISAIAAAQLRLAEQLGNVDFHVMQGGYGGSHIAASGTSHNYPGVMDVGPASIYLEKIMRRVGFAAWARNIPGRSSVGSGAHIHAVSLLDPKDSKSPQVYGSWANHGNGLSGYNNDPAPHYAWIAGLREMLGGINLNTPGAGGSAAPSKESIFALLNPANWLDKLHDMGPMGDMFGGAVKSVVGKAKDFAVEKLKAFATALIPTADFEGPLPGLVHRLASQVGWGGSPQWGALSQLIAHESSWSATAQNPSSSAYGLFQFLDSTWGTVGGHKTSDPQLQTIYGLRYIKDRYTDPVGAWSHWQQYHSYDKGGLARGVGSMEKKTLRPERVLSPRQTESFDKLVATLERNGNGGGPVVINLYDREGAIALGMRGEIDADRGYHDTLARQGL